MSEHNFERARDLFLAGVQDVQAGRLAEAEGRFMEALALVPGRASTLANLGAVRLAQGRPQEALAPLSQAAEANPGDARTWADLSAVQAQLGQLAEALASCDRALALAPEAADTWSHRGSLLKDLGRKPEAAEAFGKALSLGGDAQLNGYFLASLGGAEAPPIAPGAYVQGLFDGYAQDFDAHLVEVLGYRAHTLLAEQVQAAAGARRFDAALDLGCGTGLVGGLVRPLAGAVDGVDLSPAMVARAQASGHYRGVVQADVADYLQGTDRRYGLVVSADVFIYIGDLQAVFAGVARVLDKGGVFGFSVERADDERDWELRASQRYAHSQVYLQWLAQQHGFEVLSQLRAPLREEQRRPIEGLFVCLGRR